MPNIDLSLLTTLDPERLPDEQLRPMLRALLNVVEAVLAEVQALKAENQQLRDEINHLKGEQGKPTFKTKREPAAPANYSSERERRAPRVWQKGTKLDQIRIDRVEHLAMDPATLPADAVRKGTEAVVIQDLVLRTATVQFEREVWYSPSERKSYRAALPPGYDDGQFGPGIKALALALAYGANVSEGKLLELVRQAGVVVSAGWLAGLLSGDPGGLRAEAQAVERAGLESSPFQHSDTTETKVSITVTTLAGRRVDTESWHCHTLGNPVFTVYRTLPTKSRLGVLTLLRGGEPLTYLWNAVAEAHLDRLNLSATARGRLSMVPREQELSEAELTTLLTPVSPWVGRQQRAWFREALALAAYQAQTDWPVVHTLLCDDAAQYRQVTEELALCWVHEGRHYAKLIAHLPRHRQLLETFQDDFWNFYRDLLAYREQPTPEAVPGLEQAFDQLFGRTTGFTLLDQRIALTQEKKAGLLLVLQHPELPLHNNSAELAARQRVRKRDVSFGPRSPAGVNAWDTMMTLAATTQKLGVSFLAYLHDRFHQAARIPPLADLIRAKAATMNLGASWAPV
jgi:transposase IS66 family protein